MNAQQVDDLVAYIEANQLKPSELKKGAEQYGTDGRALFDAFCARCHTKGWSYGEPEEPGNGAFGPPLYNVLQQFPELEEHTDFVANGREYGQQYGVQGQASGRMPYFSQILTREQIDAVVEYDARSHPRKVARHYSLIPTICFNCESSCCLLAYVDKAVGTSMRTLWAGPAEKLTAMGFPIAV